MRLRVKENRQAIEKKRDDDLIRSSSSPTILSHFPYSFSKVLGIQSIHENQRENGEQHGIKKRLRAFMSFRQSSPTKKRARQWYAKVFLNDRLYGQTEAQILDGQGKTYRGLEGDDIYFVSQLLPKSGKVSITDTEGSNTIQLPVNTYVDKSLFTKNAARLTLEDGREITISGADKFSYNVGGNIADGTKGTDLTFTEFAEVFGVYDILNSSGAQTGEISDMYII